MTMFWAMALKPFLALALFAIAYVIARSIKRAIPNGRFKDILFDPSIQRRHPWKFCLLGFVTIWGGMLLFGWIALWIHNR